jgi:hypothetical protein
VELRVLRTDAQRSEKVLVDDDGTIGAFLKWQSDSGRLPYRTIVVGPGLYVAVFMADDAATVRAWLADRGLL